MGLVIAMIQLNQWTKVNGPKPMSQWTVIRRQDHRPEINRPRMTIV